MSDQVQLSVIIVSYNSINQIEKCLESLRRQKTDQVFEIIVVDSSNDGTAGLVEKKFPEVKLYRFAERKFPGEARNFGISKAKGQIIAFIDTDCTAEVNWVDEILTAHQYPDSSIGGVIGNGNLNNYVSSAAYFCEFSQWMPARNKRWMIDIPTANMSYKKKIFKEYGQFIEGTYCSDTEFHWRLNKRSQRLLFSPAIIVYHHSIDNFKRYLKHEYNHGKDFAHVRLESKNISRLRSLLYSLCFLLIAVKLFVKISLINFKNKRYLLNFLRTSPLVLLGLVFWSTGELAGYIKGARSRGYNQAGVITASS